MTDRTRLILIGTGVGAALGLIAAFVAADAVASRQRAADNNEIVASPGIGDWMKFSVAAIALMRSFAELMSPK